MAYEPSRIEPRWQRYWLENETFKAEIDHSRPKFYVLDMFPYPSGDGLHVGHPKGYTATDILARYKRMRGFNVLHPMGWDAFGLPAEQYAIKTGTHPRITTRRNVENFRRQIQSLGFSYDWSREIDTTDPGYVRWTQWIFRELHERGLAYQAEVSVNWCPDLGTVLANEEVIDGKSEVGGFPVEKRPMRQWMLRITRYADRLLEDLEGLDWPEPIKKMQRDWIGRSEGARIRFPVQGHAGQEIEVFTTRPDTLLGATYMVLAPEHPLVAVIRSDAQRAEVETYVAETAHKSERLRMAEGDDKTGVFTGAHALHPVSGEALPIWIADYVLAGYGTGAIMAVPAHDERDHAFASRFELPIVEVVAGGDVSEKAYTADGIAVNSRFLDGLETSEAKSRMNAWLQEQGVGEPAITYKLRDWLFSRQRYWGEPFPVVHLEDGSTRLLPESDLPILLPELDDWKPSGEFATPLSRVEEWIATRDPEGGGPARRDPNTMPQWAGSCWYYLRFMDPHNEEAPWSEEAERYWMPVDLYVGGAEHAVLHLLYARFWHKVLFDIGLVHTAEPFQRLVNQGMIQGFSYRYYDDNLSDAADVTPRCYSSEQVEIRGEKAVHRETGAELKARSVPLAEVRRDGKGRAFHPRIEGLELEEVVEKMSKSRGNVLNPDEVVTAHGADSMRLYEMFMGPVEKEAPWSTDGIQGVHRFLQRAYRLVFEDAEGDDRVRPLPEGPGNEDQRRLVARTIAGVTDDLENMRFNTAISKLMVMNREVGRDAPLTRGHAETFALLLAPFAPHLAEEMWAALGHAESLGHEAWPSADEADLGEEHVTLAVQVNGKRRGEIQVANDADEASVRAAALAVENVQRHLAGREPRKVIVVPGRLVNIVG